MSGSNNNTAGFGNDPYGNKYNQHTDNHHDDNGINVKSEDKHSGVPDICEEEEEEEQNGY